MNSKERLLLYTLAAVNFTHIIDFMIMMPLGPQLMKLFSISPKQFSFAVSAYSLTAGVSGFMAAFFVDRFDRKKVLFYAYVGFIIGTFSCAFAPTYELLVAARVLAGLFGGLISAQVLSIVADTFAYDRRGQAMGVVMTAFSLASVVGVPTGLWLASKFNWHAPFLVIGGLGVLVAAVIAITFPPINKHLHDGSPRRNPLEVLLSIGRSPRQLWALTLSVVLMIGHFSIIPLFTPNLVGNAGFSTDNLFLIYLVGGALTIFTSPLVGKIADNRGKYPVFVAMALFSILPVWLVTNAWPMPLWGILMIAGLFFISANGRTVPMQAMISGVVNPQQRGAFMSINSSVQQLASGLAANIGGAIVYTTADGHLMRYDWVGYMSIALLILAVLIAGKVRAEGE